MVVDNDTNQHPLIFQNLLICDVYAQNNVKNLYESVAKFLKNNDKGKNFYCLSFYEEDDDIQKTIFGILYIYII